MVKRLESLFSITVPVSFFHIHACSDVEQLKSDTEWIHNLWYLIWKMLRGSFLINNTSTADTDIMELSAAISLCRGVYANLFKKEKIQDKCSVFSTSVAQFYVAKCYVQVVFWTFNYQEIYLTQHHIFFAPWLLAFERYNILNFQRFCWTKILRLQANQNKNNCLL